MLNKVKHFYRDIQGWFDFHDVYLLALDTFEEESKDINSRVIFAEIGSWKGRSAAFMTTELVNRGMEGVSFFCLDTWQGVSGEATNPENPFQFFMDAMKPVANRFVPIVGNCQESVKTFDDKTVSFAFIDADHGYDAVKRDIMDWLPKIKPGGILAGHDYTDPNFPGVRQAVDELLPEFTIFNPSSWVLTPEQVQSAQKRLLGW